MPSQYLGRDSKKGLIDGDFIVLGTTKGDVILGKIQNQIFSEGHMPSFQILYIMNVKLGDAKEGDDLKNTNEITFIYYDLYFDIMIFGDVSSNVRCFEKVLQLGKSNNDEEIIPIFSLFYEANNNMNALTKSSNSKKDFNWDLPMFSVNHDILKDRAVIQYDQGGEIGVYEEFSDEEAKNDINVEEDAKKEESDYINY